MAIFPDWNSLESVTKIHRWAEIAGMGFLFLLFLAEVIAYRASSRKDELTEKAEHARVEEADKKLAEVQQQQAQRALSDEQKRLLVAALSPFRGQKVQVMCNWGDMGGEAFAQDFVSVFSQARWDQGEVPGHPPGPVLAVFSNPAAGVWVNVSENDAKKGPGTEAAQTLVITLAQLGVLKKPVWFPDRSVPDGKISVVFGRRPTPGEDVP
jgi:hypothetical protein